MTIENLSNKPLVEAIFELRWELEENSRGILIDPAYKLLVGQLYNNLKSSYKNHVPLPSSNMPDEIAAYVVQHQFRNGEEGWPLIQLGPGVLTLNDTDGYKWPDFNKRIHELLNVFFSTLPELNPKFKLNKLILRYIDAESFDFENENIWVFLKEKMKININLDDKLFINTHVQKLPLAFDFRFTLPSKSPKGVMNLKISSGAKNDVPSLIWDTQMHSIFEDVPQQIENIKKWVDEAHNLTHNWFFNMIDGELLEKYK